MCRIFKCLFIYVLLAFPGGASGVVKINEIMYHPPGGLLQHEFIEIYNSGPGNVDLSGWKIRNGVKFDFPDRILETDSYLVIAADLYAFNQKYPAVTNVVGEWSRKLSNQNEVLELRDAADAIIDVVEYFDEGDWAQRILLPADFTGYRGWSWKDDHNGGGKSLEVVNPSMSNDSGQNWLASIPDGGTPGAANSVFSANIAPLILSASHHPVIPRSTDSVKITAWIFDEQTPVQSVMLNHRIDGQPQFVQAAMFDDGLHDDGGSGDGLYGAILPTNANLTVIEYFITARDGQSNQRTWPAPADVDGQLQQAANALYQVNDNFSGWSPEQPSTYLVVMTEQERATLAQIGSRFPDAASNAQMNGAFISSGEDGLQIRQLCGFRNRGAGSRNRPPNNMRVNFKNDTPWRGRTAISLNSKYTHIQHLGMTVFQQSGVLAEDSELVYLRINGQDLAETGERMFGLYSQIEVLDQGWPENHAPQDPGGNLYRGSRFAEPHANLDYRGPGPLEYVNYYVKQNNEEENDYRDVIELTYGLSNNTPDEIYANEVNRLIDVSQWLRYAAVHALTSNNETCLGTGIGDDYALYRGEQNTRFRLVQHDSDTLFGKGDNPGGIDDSIFRFKDIPALKRLVEHPLYAPVYYQQLLDLSATVFAPENFNALVDATLGGKIPEAELNDIKNFNQQRVAYVLSQIPQTLTVETNLPQLNGYPRTESASVFIFGNANPAVTRSVSINGVQVIFDAQTGAYESSLTTSPVIFNPGINRVIVEAFDGSGNIVDSAFIDIWFDTGGSTIATGTLTVDTIFSPAKSPYRIQGDLVVSAGITLTIQPGTTLHFDPASRLHVQGKLLAEGVQNSRIHFFGTPQPGDQKWNGIFFDNSLSDNRMAYIVQSGSDGGNQHIDCINSQLHLEHTTWNDTNHTVLRTTASNLRVSDCEFPKMTDAETVVGHDVRPDGFVIFENNIFNTASGVNDIIDFAGSKRPDAIIQIYNNEFLGGGDDGLDFDGTDAHIEGNHFSNFAQAIPGGDSSANAIATGKKRRRHFGNHGRAKFFP